VVCPIAQSPSCSWTPIVREFRRIDHKLGWYCTFFNAHAQTWLLSTSGLKSDVIVVFSDPDFLYDVGIPAEIVIVMFVWIFRTFWPKMTVLGSQIGKSWCDVDPNKLVLNFGGCYLCDTFGENRSRNATVIVRTDREIDRRTHAHTETN